MATSTLPLLALPHPLILLPTSRFTVPVSKEIGDAILNLIDHSDALPVIAAVPLTQPSTSNQLPDSDTPQPQQPQQPPLSEWGTAARVLRLVKPPARNPRQPYLVSLHGLTRVRLIHIHANKNKFQLIANSLPVFDVEYPPTEQIPTKEAIERFKQAALRLLDRLARDAAQPARKEGYNKIASMLDDIADARTPWMADVLVGSINTDYADKLGPYYSLPRAALIHMYSQLFSVPRIPPPGCPSPLTSFSNKPLSPKCPRKSLRPWTSPFPSNRKSFSSDNSLPPSNENSQHSSGVAATQVPIHLMVPIPETTARVVSWTMTSSTRQMIWRILRNESRPWNPVARNARWA